MKYFAYGSNLLEERLKAVGRAPDAIFEATGFVKGYKLLFNKRSDDGSGKCNIVKTNSIEDVVYGVVFDVSDISALNTAEGEGRGYSQDYNIPVQLSNGTTVDMLAYVADPAYIEDNLIPYEWYYNLVVAGAEQHKLPEEYIAKLKAVHFVDDPRPNRRTKLEAEAAIDEYYKNTQTEM